MFGLALFWVLTFFNDFFKILPRSLASGLNLSGKFCSIEIYLDLFLLFAEYRKVVI